MLKKVKLEGIVTFKEDEKVIEEFETKFEWEREEWQDEDIWTWYLDDFLWEIAERKLKERGIDVYNAKMDTFFDWDAWAYCSKPEVDLHITIYDDDGNEKDFLLTFKVYKEEREEEE